MPGPPSVSLVYLVAGAISLIGLWVDGVVAVATLIVPGVKVGLGAAGPVAEGLAAAARAGRGSRNA